MPTSKRCQRNLRIKAEVSRLIGEGYSLKEASYAVADKWYLSQRQVERIYYETREA